MRRGIDEILSDAMAWGSDAERIKSTRDPAFSGDPLGLSWLQREHDRRFRVWAYPQAPAHFVAPVD